MDAELKRDLEQNKQKAREAALTVQVCAFFATPSGCKNGAACRWVWFTLCHVPIFSLLVLDP